MEQGGEEGRLVETGTFRVDTGRMLEVLSKYQLETPLHALRELVRCAVLAGAPRLRLTRAKGAEGRGFLARFGGRGFTAAELGDVYAPLLAGEDGPGRHLAAAVLALTGTRPSRLTLASGGAAVELAGAGPAEIPEAGGHNSLLVLWAEEPPGLKLQAVEEFPLSSEAALACCPIPVLSDEAESPGFAARDKSDWGAAFSGRGRRGLLKPLFEDGAEPLTGSVPAAVSTVGVHAAGVYAETLKLELGCVPVVAEIGDDGLPLDASMARCVRGERFAELPGVLKAWTLELLKKEAGRQELDLHAVGRRLKKAGYRRLWRERMSDQAAWKKNLYALSSVGLLAGIWRALTTVGSDPVSSYFSTASSEDLYLFGEAGRRTWWLQDACRRALRGGLEGGGSPEAELLRAVPVLFSTLGSPLSLAQVRRRRKNGSLQVTEAFRGEQYDNENPSDAVWLSSRRDREFLAAFVPEGEWRA